MYSDPMADMLTRIRNASRAEHEKVDIPSSKLKIRVAEVLKDEGFIRNFRVAPVMNEDAFVNAIPLQDYRYDFSFSNIEMQNINLPQLFEANIIADTMLIGPASFKVYCDVGIPSDRQKRKERYPLHVIEVIPVPVRIGKIMLSDSFVEYKERSSITRKSGKVQFYSVNASIRNVTNDKNVIAVNNVMTANISARFLNRTPLKTNWRFYLLHPKGRFDVNGSLAAMEGAILNPLTLPMGPARINKGKLNSLEFNLQGNDNGMDGSLKMLYDDFNITMLEKDRGAKELDRKSFTSIMANLLIINSNPRKHGDVRVAQVHVDRNTNQSIFYLSWKTLFTGIEETVGIRNR
jgi:ribosomal protein S8